tara:strand:- start:5222 stop:5683 length:462 start_codon:yes stop_codon:yes gene_type:complete
MAIVKRIVKGSALTHSELDGNFTDYEGFKGKFDTTVYVAGNDGSVLYYDHASTSVKVKEFITTNITEGTNKFFTDARADARATLRIAAASITNLNDVDAVVAGDDGKFLYYDHSSTSFKWTATIPGYYSLADWKTLIAASTDFADFQSRVAAL